MVETKTNMALPGTRYSWGNSLLCLPPFSLYQSITSSPRSIQISRVQTNKKIRKIIACFNCEQVHFLSTPMLPKQQIRRGHNLRKVWGKYTVFARFVARALIFFNQTHYRALIQTGSYSRTGACYFQSKIMYKNYR